MNRFFLLAIVLCTVLDLQAAEPGKSNKFAYPAARRSEQVDDYHGTRVADPYRLLEELDTPETREWVTAENKLTFGFLEKIPEREAIRKRLTSPGRPLVSSAAASARTASSSR